MYFVTVIYRIVPWKGINLLALGSKLTIKQIVEQICAIIEKMAVRLFSLLIFCTLSIKKCVFDSENFLMKEIIEKSTKKLLIKVFGIHCAMNWSFRSGSDCADSKVVLLSWGIAIVAVCHKPHAWIRLPIKSRCPCIYHYFIVLCTVFPQVLSCLHIV